MMAWKPLLLICLSVFVTELIVSLLLHKSSSSSKKTMTTSLIESADVIVVGSGLAGQTVVLNVLDRGGRVVIVEKEHSMGGNSNKASSGINQAQGKDDAEDFYQDTLKSAGELARPDMIRILVDHSNQALKWLQDRVGVKFDDLGQLGGHSRKRTHRPSGPPVGFAIMKALQNAIKEFPEGKIKILVDTKVTSLITDPVSGRVIGIMVDGPEGTQHLYATNVVLATGGFAADRSSGSYLEQYRPDLMRYSATAGAFSTGDGISLATKLGASMVDMDKVQIHPTGWVDPADPDNKSKILAAELMRGVGGILMNSEGKRFCNELGTRAYVTKMMLSHDDHFAKTGVWDKSSPIPTFSLVLTSEAASNVESHLGFYTYKGLLTRIEGISALAAWMGTSAETLRETYNNYIKSAAEGKDEFGKVSFRGLPGDDLEREVFYAGTVVSAALVEHGDQVRTNPL
jgi:flavocytochrome c